MPGPCRANVGVGGGGLPTDDGIAGGVCASDLGDAVRGGRSGRGGWGGQETDKELKLLL